MSERCAWAVLWRSKNRLDGYHEHLCGTPDHPCRTLLFESRRKARNFIRDKYGYIRTRPDLRREPHGWRMPTAVRVTITIALQ